MRARPILFSSSMVRSLLAGSKTQTRRIVKPQPAPHESWDWSWPVLRPGVTPGTRICWRDDVRAPNLFPYCPYGVPGDLLIVRETHWRWGQWRKDGLTKGGHQRWRFRALDTHPVAYCAPDDKRLALGTCYPGMDRETVGYWRRPSLFLERKHSRLTLEITDVRVERLADISEADALAEGVTTICPRRADGSLTGEGPNHFTTDLDISGLRFSANAPTAAGVYQMLWEHINGDGSWADNPWVWALSFNVHRQNVDAVLKDRGAA
jgi:hypothetical protein